MNSIILLKVKRFIFEGFVGAVSSREMCETGVYLASLLPAANFLSVLPITTDRIAAIFYPFRLVLVLTRQNCNVSTTLIFTLTTYLCSEETGQKAAPG